MKIDFFLKKFLIYLKKHSMKELVTCCLVMLAGVSAASIGTSRIIDTLQIWLSSSALWGPSFDTMVPFAIISIAILAPCIIFFILAYMVFESHSLGEKLVLILSIGCLAFGVYSVSVAITLAGVLCLWAAEISLLIGKKTSKRPVNSPIVTENVARLGLLISGLIGIIILFGVISYISVRGISYISWDFVTGSNWHLSGLRELIDGTGQMGISHPVVGSFLIVGLCEVIALPLGLGAAIYMAEYAPKNIITDTIKFFIELLAGAPSIVIALFGFFVFVYGPVAWGTSWLAASVCLAFMTLPWNIRVAEEAMITVPYSYREGAYALGATKWQTIRRTILLSASPGIITGFILGMGAALGETTILLLTSDLGQGSLPAGLPLTKAGMVSLPVQIYRTIMSDIGGGGKSYYWDQANVAFAEGFVLLILFLSITVLALIARNYLTKKAAGN